MHSHRRLAHRRLAAVITGLLLAAGGLTAGPLATAAVRPAAPGAAPAPAAVPIAGTGVATAHSVTVHSASVSPKALAAARPGPVLGNNGKPAGSSAATVAGPSSRSALPASQAQLSRTGPNTGPNASKAPRPVTPDLKSAAARTTASTLSDPSFTGATEANSNCSNCAVPYVTAAVSTTEIAETVNLSLQVFSKSGSLLCSQSLSGLLGALGGLTEPRIQYDNASKRYSLVIASMPSTSSDVPVFYLATSQADDACGAWWVYTIILSGTQYPLGAQLNYPYLGQDNTSLLASTNNFTFGSGYLGTGAFAMPKSAAYSGNSFNITTYSVAFSTAPVTVAGIPTFSTTTTYWLAAVPGTGYDVYSMPTNPAGAISLAGTVSAPFSAPSRQVRQPGTNDTLNPLDGRLQSSAVQDHNTIWFASDIDFNGFPTVLYGAINGVNGAISDAVAYHSNTSDDFNPSIGVSDQGGGTVAIWVNWAYTDSSAGLPVSAAINGVAPGGGVPNLAGTDLTLKTGTSTTSITSFGAYSSVEIDPSSSPSCPAGLTALSAQEYFSSASQWATQLATTTFC